MFLANVLREQNGNRLKPATTLDMRRNTSRRLIPDLELHVKTRVACRRPP
jgi:hypothetical protein